MQGENCNKEKIKALEDTIVKQNNEIAKLQNMEEAFSLQREEITALNKGNNKITELRTILQRESQNS
jgi:hypothetical protein